MTEHTQKVMLKLLIECEEALDDAVSQLCDTLEFEEGDDTDDHLTHLAGLAMRCRDAIQKARSEA